MPVADRIGRAAVLGRPIAHSLSPVLHRAAYAALGLDWTYEALDCGVDELPGVLAARPGWAGFSCTMPLKRAVLAAAAEIRPLAAIAGAGNTLLPGRRGWIADNTDGPGLAAALAAAGVHAASVTLLGAGGTAQSVLAVLPGLGVDRAVVLVREPARAGEARAAAGRAGVALDVRRLDVHRPDDAGDAWDAELIVSTLPRGAADPLARRGWRPGQTVVDVVYDPWPTALARAAAGAGARVLGGAQMLLHQAALQVEAMTGTEAPLPAMRAALESALADR